MKGFNKDNITLEEVNKEIAEIKKKIQLAEGQRKAQYEELDQEKRKNVEKVASLKDEIKSYTKQLTDLSGQCRLQELSSQEVVFRNTKLKKLKRYKFSSEPTTICKLENEIHEISANILEADHLCKKYRIIVDKLSEESILFESTIEKVERENLQKGSEINSLKKIYEEALRCKSETYESLEKREGALSEIRHLRNKQMQSLRQQVEDCKSALEKMERQIIPAYETGKKINLEDDDELNKRSEYLECAFSILREVTGVTRNEHVMDRFLSQKQTKESLENLKTLLENDKKTLERKKQEMMSELESYRFTDTTEREHKQEEIDKMKEEVEKERDEYDKIQEEYMKKELQLTDVVNKIYSICKQIKGVDEVSVPDKCPSKDKYDWLLCILRWKLGKIKNERKDNKPKKGEERDTGKSPNVIWTSPELRVSDMDEEEDVPTRNTLKRQSQLIFEMKSRKKGYKTVQIKGF